MRLRDATLCQYEQGGGCYESYGGVKRWERLHMAVLE